MEGINMTNEGKEFMGKGGSLEEATKEMYVDASSKAGEKEGQTLNYTLKAFAYQVGFKNEEGLVQGDFLPDYDLALVNALGCARISVSDYKAQPDKYQMEVTVRGKVDDTKSAEKGKPSGAAPMGGRSGRNITDLF